MATLPGLVQGLKKAFKWFAAFDGVLRFLFLFCLLLRCHKSHYPCWGGGHVHVRRIWSRGMCFHCYVPLGQGFSSLFWEDEIGNWQVARDLGHSEVNQLVIGMDCSWQSTISILIFSDIRWYAMLPNDIFYYNIPNLRDLVLDAVSTSWHRNAARTQHWRQYSSTTSFSDSKSRGKWPRRIKEKSLLGLWHYPLGAYCMTGSVVASFTRTQPTTKQHVRRPTSGCQGQQDNPETLNCQWCIAPGTCDFTRGVVNAMARQDLS